MDSLQKKLQREIQQQPNLQIEKSSRWGLPVETVNISYTTIKRTTMDILMKMMLLTIDKLPIADPKMVADFLAVDSLFAEDLLEKMKRADMIRKRKGVFELTQNGAEQLQSGIYEQAPEQKEIIMYYSACHENILCEEKEDLIKTKIEPFRLAKKQKHKMKSLHEELLRSALLSAGVEMSEGPLQIVLDKINPAVHISKQLILCIEFSVYNRSENMRFTRVWNTLLDQWDEKLEKLIDLEKASAT
ncbi:MULTISPECIES: hypothetical protein [unclassified Sporosarcina]|uniref:hypothetical protein n=1 Tax=unclassified Sporosarcina TaxID=2647733 RepID=UPI00203CCD87|nr:MULTISPECIES: hypothetical protein [unclassified Sporosarcina]GKV65006.1 hypothetical protein NCCP2331_11590 [Sporosarcina sp. NCCP-2331]GLB56641.1 hypothetical protein NCCP2378_24280 [Sporosarcina sp. NCCP-2378]